MKYTTKELVSKVITIIIGLVLLIILMLINQEDTNKAIDECIKSGNTYNYCFSKLS